MTSMFDMYLRDTIMTTCEKFFNNFLEKEGVPDERLTDEEREQVSIQIDNLLIMMEDIYRSHDDDLSAYTEIADKLVGISVLAKMNETRLCRLLNKLTDELKDD